MGKILVVDDESSIVLVIKALLGRAGHTVSTADNSADALKLLAEKPFDLMITDVRLPGIDGITLIQKAKEQQPGIEVIVMTAYSDMDNAMNAMKSGAIDYLVKPFNFNELIENVDKNLSATQIVGTSSSLQKRSPLKYHYNLLIGESSRMMDVYRQIEHAGTATAPILLTGPAGTGKELIARVFYYNDQTNANCVSLDCALLSPLMMRQELFRVADPEKNMESGLLQLARKGTLILQNADLIPRDIQHDLAEVVREKMLLQIRENKKLDCVFRLIATTAVEKKNLKETAFHPDFLNLFSTLRILEIPSLRERGSDISLFILKFLEDYENEHHIRMEISTDAVTALKQQTWEQGNIDQLLGLLRAASARNSVACIELADLEAEHFGKEMHPELQPQPFVIFRNAGGQERDPEEQNSAGVSTPARLPLERQMLQMEKQYLKRVVKNCGNDESLASLHLGISAQDLKDKLQDN